jgi:YidC/Oxa1 family membrane protein insertase
MMVLPLAFLTVISRFPMGLTLYWMTTNLWTVGQGLVTRRLVPKTPAPISLSGGGRSSRTPPKAGDGGGASNGKGEAEPKQAAKRPQQPRTQRRKRGGARR